MSNTNIRIAAAATAAVVFAAAVIASFMMYFDDDRIKRKLLYKLKPSRTYSNASFSKRTDNKILRSRSADGLDKLSRNRSSKGKKSDLSSGESKSDKKGKLVIAMVGLPGRGKTYVARKVARYLRWIDHATMVFSVAKYRLEDIGPQNAEFFNPQNAEFYQKRVQTLTNALEDLISYLYRDGDVAILDGTNTSFGRREIILKRVAQEPGFQILWIEMVTESQDHLATWIQENVAGSPEFQNQDNYEKRLMYYRQEYTPLNESEGSYIKMFDNGLRLELHKINGFLPAKVSAFVLNLHTQPRPIFLVRSGESDFNSKSLLGGDSSLSARGKQFATAVAAHLAAKETGVDCSRLCVWSSCMRRASETAEVLPCDRLVRWQALREIELGVCDGLSQEEVKTRFPEEFAAFQQDPLRFRYPRAENYLDVVARLEPLIFELEQQRAPICVVAHQAVLRALYAYFLDVPQQEIPFLGIPLHTITRLDPRAYVCQEKRVKIIVPLDS